MQPSRSPLLFALLFAVAGCDLGILDPIITTGHSSESTDPIMTSTGTSTGDPDSDGGTTIVATTTTATTTTATTSENQTEAVFITPGDPPAQCDPWAQDCPAGEKCSAQGPPPVNTGSIACQPIVPTPAQLHDECEVLVEGHLGPDTCDIGLYCNDVDPVTGKGTCLPLCHGSSNEPACDTDLVCLNTALPMCIPACDPLLQDCPAGDLCLDVSNGFGCWPTPPDAIKELWEGCDAAWACEPGLICITPEGISECAGNGDALGCCSTYCDLGDPNACAGTSTSCKPWYEAGMAPAGFESLGACVGV